MLTIAPRAHYDAKQVTLLAQQSTDEREGWASLSARNLAAAYGNEEPEYSASDVRQ